MVRILTGRHTTAPQTTAKKLQLLQFRVRFTERHADRSQWLSAIADTFEHVLHRAFITADSGYLLLTESLTDTSADLASLLALIDNDFILIPIYSLVAHIGRAKTYQPPSL